MTDAVPKQGVPHWVGSVALAAALVVGGVVFRNELVAWFTGGSVGEASNKSAVAQAGTGAAPSSASASATGASGASTEAIDHYTCSMHPSVNQKKPGKCPICGMELVPVTKAQQNAGVVMIDEARRQIIGVRIGTVVEAPMRRSFRAVGRVTYDESKLTDVTLKVRGWITKLFVSQTGQRVQQGQPLFQLYSPELFSAEQDFLLVSQGSSAPTAAAPGTSRVELLTRAARQRLHLLGLGDAEIDAIQKSGTPSESIPFPSPASGFVIEKDVVEGAAFEAGMRLYRIAQLDKVWVEAEVYEADLAHVHVGQAATVTLDYLPGHVYDAKISYVYPFLDPTARTGRVRVELANKSLELRPGMYATVMLASAAEPHLQVPASAVVYTGPRRLVFVDLGDGRFRPQEVRVGAEADGMDEVLAGLEAGDRVATSGVFLIAAEARISTAAKYWDNAPEEPTAGDAALPAPPSASAPPPPSSSMPLRPPESVPTSTRAKTAPQLKAPPTSSAPQPTGTVFTCPMHPEVQSDKPGQCPKCGMDLVPKPKGDSK
jgi:Cu(I)/Ag(I) efflux system membrane fusion protein